MPCPPKETPSTDDSKLSLTNIAAPTNLDVLCGRGVATNRHVGNESFRALVKRHKETYVCSTKAAKMKMSRYIVQTIRAQKGRFLEKDVNKNLWMDIGDKKAIEKTSQALRDGAAPLRRQLAEKAAEIDRQKETSKEEITSTKGGGESLMTRYPEKDPSHAKQKNEQSRGRMTDGKNDMTKEAGLNFTQKDSTLSDKCYKPKEVHPGEDIYLSVTRRVSENTSPHNTQESLATSTPVSGASHPSIAPDSILSELTHFATDGPTTVSPVPNNMRLDNSRSFSPIPSPQCSQVTAEVSPAPNNNSIKDDSFSPLHHVPNASMDKYGWLLSQQVSTPNNELYDRGHHRHTSQQGSGYDYGVSPNRTLPPPNPAIISSLSNHQASVAQHHKNHLPPCLSPQHNRYKPAAIGPESHSTGRTSSFSYTSPAYPKMQMKQKPLREWEREHMQNKQNDIQSMKCSPYAFYDRRRDNAQPNMVEASYEDASQNTYDDMITAYGDMSPLPYTSDDECLGWTMAPCEREDDSLKWDVPDGYDIRHRFLMNLIQSPLLE